jgi:23S rRNA-/tRNA-specific pseudouridylate synthase
MKHDFDDLSRRVIRSSVDWSNAGNRLIDYLAGRFTYRSAEEWRVRIADGEIMLNGERVSPETLLNQHDIIEYFPGDIPEPPADLDYKVVFEDDTLLVIDKPGNLCVHPAGPFFKHTLWHLLSSRYGKVHIINRLDRETSGLLIAAKTPAAAARLSSRNWELHKEYLALVFGEFGEETDAKGFLVPDTGSVVRRNAVSFLICRRSGTVWKVHAPFCGWNVPFPAEEVWCVRSRKRAVCTRSGQRCIRSVFRWSGTSCTDRMNAST